MIFISKNRKQERMSEKLPQHTHLLAHDSCGHELFCHVANTELGVSTPQLLHPENTFQMVSGLTGFE